ncbi:MAG TPA: PilN domain-containing protein [Methylophilaceae bacterium]|nr:PilN domain-containing protein [Methylotenera sp.]HSH71807.1 PilN domain-containing protein [Methylophilaceae bacterium]
MVRINLLPHRQIKRAERQREFSLMLVGVAIAAAAIVFLGQTFINSSFESQASRNKRLEDAIASLDKEIDEIKELKTKIGEVLERKQVVENLQTNRGQAVVLLDELARKLPEGVYLKSIKQAGTLVTLEGVADTNARVATLVRNFSTSEALESPGLVEIKAELINSVRRNNFTLNVTQKIQKTEEVPGTKKAQGQ